MRYFVLVFALCHSFFVQSQVVSGRVVNIEDGRGIAYAGVFYTEILQGTIADSMGNFQIKAVDKFRNIRVTAVGFYDQIIPVNEIAGTQIKLTPRLYQIDEVAIVGTQSKELILGCSLKNPKAMTITLDEINSNGFFLYCPGHFDAKLNSIGLHINKIINPKIKLHFRLLDPDTTFHSLGFDKLKTDKYAENLQKGWNDIELGDENIRLSKNGIIVFFYFTDAIKGDIISISCSNDDDYSWMSSTNYSKDFSFGRKYKPAMRLKIYQ